MTDAASHVPHPLRFWWLKRIMLSLLLVIVVLAVLRVIWGWRVQREYEALIASYRAKGEPTTAADFAEEPIPDEENAVPLLRQAAGLVKFNKALLDAEYDEGFIRTPVAPKNLRLLHAEVAAHAASLPLVRQARQRPRAWWDLPLLAPYNRGSGPDRSAQMDLGRLLAFAAMGALADGDDRAALEYVRDILFITRAGTKHPDPYHAALQYPTHRACVTLILAAPELAIDDAGTTVSGRRAASRRQVRELIAELLDEAEADDAIVNVFYASRLQFTDFREQSVPIDVTNVLHRFLGNRHSPLAEVLLRPVLDRNAIDALRHLDAVIGAVRIEDWDVARDSLDRDHYSYARPGGPYPRQVPIVRVVTVDIMRGQGMWQPSSKFISHRAFSAYRRAAALRLAMRLYEIDNGGSLPPSLGALAPQYIRHVPADPFGDGKASFEYVVSGSAPYLCSPGPNGKYDIADGTWSPADPRSVGWFPDPDFVFPLRPRPMVAPTRLPATSPVQDD